MNKRRLLLGGAALLALLVIAVFIVVCAGPAGSECYEFILPDGTVTGCGDWR